MATTITRYRCMLECMEDNMGIIDLSLGYNCGNLVLIVDSTSLSESWVCVSCLGCLHKTNETSWNKQDKSSPWSSLFPTEYRETPAYLDQKSIFHMSKVMWDKPHNFSAFFFWISITKLGITFPDTLALWRHHPLLCWRQSHAIVLTTAL